MKVSESVRSAVFASKREGKTIKDICQSHNLSKATVHRVLATRADTGPELTIKEIEVKNTIPVNTFETNALEFSKILSDATPTETMAKTGKTKVSGKEVDSLIEELVGKPGDLDEEVGLPQIPTTPRPRPASHIRFAEPDEPEDMDLHNQLEQKIILNIQNFGPIFHFIRDKEAFIKSLHDKRNAELKGILTTLETTRTTVNLSNQMKQMFFMVSKGAEFAGSAFLKLKTDGFTDNLIQQQQELDMIFREIAIEYAPMFKMTNKPELRLAMVFTMTLIQTDSLNRLKDSFANQQFSKSKSEENTSPEQKYEDL